MEKEQFKKIDKNLLRRLLKYARPYMRNFAAALGIILLIVVLELYQPILIGQAVDGFLADYTSIKTVSGGDQAVHAAGIIRIAVIYLFTVILIFLLQYGQARILARTGQNIIYNMRMEIFTHLSQLSLSFFNKNPIGKLVTRVTNDTEALNEMYTSVIVNILKSVFCLIWSNIYHDILQYDLVPVNIYGNPLYCCFYFYL